jgi:DNA-binding SARP family transcriptional activator
MIRLHGIGQCSIDVGDTRLTPSADTLFAAALYMVLEAGRPIERRELIEVLWPGAADRKANQRLRQTLYKLNTMGAALRCDRTHVVLPSRSVQSDCSVLLEASERAEMERLADEIPGAFLPGYAPRFSVPYLEWLDRQRDLVTSALRRVLVAGMNARKARGEWRRAEPLAMRCLAIDPLNEEATLVLAEAAALSGSKVKALAILDRYLRDIGPDAREIRLPATLMRRRIAEVYHGDLIPVRESPQVGRDAEMAELTRALHAAGSSHGSSFIIWGEPGIGKTRLVTEFGKGAVLDQVQLARVGCQSHDERRPLSAFVDLVPRLLELRGSVGCSPESMKFLKRLIAHDPNDTSFSPDSRESELLFSNIRRSVFDLLDAIAAEGKLIVVIEDIHWLDRMSWEIMRDIPSWVATRPVVVLLTSRVATVASHFSDGEQGSPTMLHVLPLLEEPSQELLRYVTAGTIREGNSAFLNWCVSSAGGNPYYLTELAFHTSWDGEQYQAPATLSKLISERLNRLDPLSKRVLQACCILGKLSTLERLEMVLGENRLSLLAALDELEAFGLVESEMPKVYCKHELLSSAALARLSKLSAALLHRHAAQALEQDVSGMQSTALLWECARHWQQAGERERAITMLRTCAHHSIEMGLPTEAVTLLDHAMSMASDHEESLPIAETQVTALYLADFWEKLPSTIELLCRLREQGNHPCEVHTEDELLGLEAEWRLGGNIQALFTRLVSCIDSRASVEHRVRAGMLALMLADNLCSRDAAEVVHSSIRPHVDSPDVHAATRTYFNMIYACSFGDATSAPAFARDLIAHARANGNAATLSRTLRHASIAFEVAGLIRDAETAAIEAFSIAEKLGLENAATGAIASLVGLYSRLGQVADAEDWHRRAMHHRAPFSGAINQSNLIGFEVRRALQCGWYDDAEFLIDLANYNLAPGASLRHRAEIAAQRIQLTMLRDNQDPDESDVEALLTMHYAARCFNWHDYVALVLFEALARQGQRTKGADLASEYVGEYRRGLSPLLPQLEECLDKLEVRAAESTSDMSSTRLA